MAKFLPKALAVNPAKEKVSQVLQLLQALRKARESMEKMSLAEAVARNISPQDKEKAIDILTLVYRELDESLHDRSDVLMGSILNRFDEKTRCEVRKVLSDIGLPKLSHFGGRSWNLIRSAFDAAGVACPLALVAFHTAYQEVRKTLLPLRKDSPNPIGFADMR